MDVCQGLAATGRPGDKGLKATLWDVGTILSPDCGGGRITVCVYSDPEN